MRRWRLGACLLSTVVSVGVIVAANTRTTTYLLQPGAARDVAPLLHATGATLDDEAGRILFTTVALGRASVLDRMLAPWLYRREFIAPADRHPDDLTVVASPAAAMQSSKVLANYVALRLLGYHVAVSSRGVVVVQVDADAPAHGVIAVGDVLESVEGVAIDQPAVLRERIRAHAPGDRIQIGLLRQDPQSQAFVARTVYVTLGADPDRGDTRLGVLATLRADATVTFPVEFEIDSGAVTGPSAGLAFTLAILDALSPGDLTGGHVVAATGTIDAGGGVGPVGGVRAKVQAACDAGAEVFLVPVAHADDARQAGQGCLQVIAVASITEAIDALVALGGRGVPRSS